MNNYYNPRLLRGILYALAGTILGVLAVYAMSWMQYRGGGLR